MRRVPALAHGAAAFHRLFLLGRENGDGGWGRIDGLEVLTPKREGLRAIAVG
jgi:hypothetical protein